MRLEIRGLGKRGIHKADANPPGDGHPPPRDLESEISQKIYPGTLDREVLKNPGWTRGVARGDHPLGDSQGRMSIPRGFKRGEPPSKRSDFDGAEWVENRP